MNKTVRTFEEYNIGKDYFETEPLNEEIDITKMFKGKTKEEKRQSALRIINEHPKKKELYRKLSPDKAEKFVEFVTKNPHVRYFKWDNNDKEFIEIGQFYGIGTSR